MSMGEKIKTFFAHMLEPMGRCYLYTWEHIGNHRLWDTSNRSINVIINNLKGIFFDDDDFEHMSFSVEAGWGEMGLTEVIICSHNELKSAVFSAESHKNHEHPQIIMEKTAQSEKRCRYPHQTDFPSRIPGSQKPRNSKGFDNLPPQMAEQNSQGRGMGDTASSSNMLWQS